MRFWKRWQMERQKRVLQEDLLSLERVVELSQIELLAGILPERVGSPLSINNLREDLQVSFDTVSRWITILENLYFCFRLPPYSQGKALRLVTKERKLYMWDWSLVSQGGARFENFVASHLLKLCHFIEDTQGDAMDLRFLRSSSTKLEIDFVVLRNKKPWFAVECKTGEKGISPAIEYFRRRTDIPQFFQVHLGSKDAFVGDESVRILPFTTLCQEIPLV